MDGKIELRRGGVLALFADDAVTGGGNYFHFSCSTAHAYNDTWVGLQVSLVLACRNAKGSPFRLRTDLSSTGGAID